MEDNNNQMDEIRDNNVKTTKQSPEDIQEKHKKCGCFIF